MPYIVQNAIRIYYKGNTTILNSRYDGITEKFYCGKKVIKISGGKSKFIGDYEYNDDEIIIDDLRITNDDSIDKSIDRLIWPKAIDINGKHSFVWVFANELTLGKLERIIEEQTLINPYTYKIIKTIYERKVTQARHGIF